MNNSIHIPNFFVLYRKKFEKKSYTPYSPKTVGTRQKIRMPAQRHSLLPCILDFIFLCIGEKKRKT